MFSIIKIGGEAAEEPYLIKEGSTERQNVQSVAQLAHALCKSKLTESALVKIFWPKDKCPLLRDDVVFVDSPGIDVSPNLDEWIDKYCLDADVFVLVSNAESTLMLTVKIVQILSTTFLIQKSAFNCMGYYFRKKTFFTKCPTKSPNPIFLF